MKSIRCSVLFVTAMLTFGNCASSPPPPPPAPPPPTSASSITTQHGVAGGMAVDVATTTATVIAIDQSTRTLTLLQSDGSKVALVCGPEVKNFPQIHVGDHVKASLSTELAVFVRKGGQRGALQDAAYSSVVVAPLGAKPGIVNTTTAQVTGRIIKLDYRARRATLQFSDGRTETYAVRPDVDMSKATLGDEVVMRSTEVTSLVVETPAQ
jgi:hypothetical protein